MATGMRRPSSTFRDLAQALTDEERRSLLRRISQSLNLKPGQREEPFRSAATERSRGEIIVREIRALGFWDRLRWFVRRLFSTKSDEQAYVEFRLSGLRSRARSVCPNLGSIEHHSVSSAVPDHTWELYRVAYPVIPLFLDFWKGGNYLQESVEYLLSQRIPAARGDLYDFASLDELQDVFMKNELKGDVRRLVVSRLDEYLDEVPEELFHHLEEGLLPFYFLKELCLLDYNGFFDVFGFDPGIAPPEETPPFRDAPASAALPVMETLYYGLHSAGKLEPGFYFHTEILDRYLEMKSSERDTTRAENRGGVDTDSSETGERQDANDAEENAYQRRRIHLQEMREEIQRLHEASRRLLREVPFADLIRFYHRDPWLKIKPYLPDLKLREFYRSYLMIRVLTQLDRSFPDIRRGVVDKMTRELFDGSPPPLSYFRPGVQLTPEQSGLPVFLHLRSVGVTYSFLRFIYRGRMQEIIRTLSRILPVRQRDSSSDLVVHVSGIEEAMADLEDFDESFSPDTDDGKSYYRVRYAVENDVTLQRSYRNLVQQRDREAALLVDAATEHIQGLSTVFDAILRSLTDHLRERYASADSRVNSLDGLDRLLETNQAKLDKFVRLVRQVRAMEEGY
ncbi:MAG: hypothetical protein ACOC1I_01420 [Spirochaetota bacterium]